MTEPIDIRPFAEGSTGVPYVHRLETGAPGPSVVVNVLTHGNEIAGARVAERLLLDGPRPRRGRLMIVFANHRAYARVDARDPAAGRSVDRDFNRVWDPALLEGSGDAWELHRARELRPVYGAADALLDLHTTATDDPPFLIATEKPATLALLARMPVPERRILMPEPMHQGRLLVEADEFADPASPRAALVAECGLHRSPTALADAWSITLAFLAATGVVDGGDTPAAAASRSFRMRRPIIPASDAFRFTRPFVSFDAVAAHETFATEPGHAHAAGFARAVILMPRLRPRAGVEAGFLAEELVPSPRPASDPA